MQSVLVKLTSGPEPRGLRGRGRRHVHKLEAERMGRRNEFIQWLERSGLSDLVKVSPVGERFGMVFIEATEEAIEQIRKCPMVESVAQDQEMRVALLGVSAKSKEGEAASSGRTLD